jgi:hypothetical protein
MALLNNLIDASQTNFKLKRYVLGNQYGILSLGTHLDGRGNRALHGYHQGQGSGLLRQAHGYNACIENQG